MGYLTFALISGVKGQTQVVNLTTGTGAVGNNDPIWTTVTMPNLVTVAPIVSNGTMCANVGGAVTGTYPNNICGDWISPHTIAAAGATFGMIPSNTGQVGNYVYTMTYNSSYNCPVASATINLSNAGADNNLVSISVNGNAYAIGVPFNPLSPVGPINVNPANLINGMNTITVVVNNTSTYSALFMCGNLTINYGGTPTPVITSASSFCQGDALTFDGSSSSGLIQNHFWEIASCDAQGNYTGQVWNSWFAGTPGSITFGHFIGFIPVCGKYYRIKLAVSNNCIDWVETTTIIFIECPPKVITETPEPVCEGTSVTLSVSGDADDYEWLPDNIHNTSIVVTPSTTTTYTVIGTGANGCTAAVPVTITVLPLNLDIDLSTGLDNTGTLILPGNDDDTWKVRGIPGTIYTSSHAALANAKVVSPLTSTWVSSSNENWITVPAAAASNGNPQEVPETHTDYSPYEDNFYWFESEFTLPSNSYTNLRIEASESAVDNGIVLFLNSQILTGNSNNSIYSLSTSNPANFNTLHYPGTIAINQSLYQTGQNTLLAMLLNNGGSDGISYLGLLLNAHVMGECVSDGKKVIIPEDVLQNERIDATTYLYPNPSAGNFTISCEGEIISSIIVKNAIGKIVKTLKNVNTSNVNILLENENKGFYFVEIIFVGQSKPVYKKMILE